MNPSRRPSMRIALYAVAALALAGCGGVEEPTTESTTEELRKPCPLFIPYCPPECKLVGSCPPKCQCPGNLVACGSGFCRRDQTCCIGQPFPDHGCVDGTICPI